MNFLEFALQMEMDGIDFYTAKAEENKENSLHKVFVFLAKDELRHASLIRDLGESKFGILPDNEAFASIESVFNDADMLTDGFYTSSAQLSTYHLAREIEKKSIDLYNKELHQSEDPKEQEVFRFLLKQEQKHFELFEELCVRVGRPEEWIEAAEFGEREDY